MELSGSKLGSGGTPQHQALMVEQVLGEDSHQALMEEDILREEEIGCNSGSAETTRDEVIINVPMGSTGPTQQDFQAQREVVTNNRDSSGLLSELPNIRSTSHQAQTKELKNPVLSGAGWRKIVNENGVRPDDKLIFSGHQDAGADGVQYMIQVIRQIVPLYGKPVTVEVVKLKSQTQMTFQGQPM
ncbi:hypothetical protein LWI29_026189 [Acer saccharum]|uniref:Uncharacterized protein n=1 Tax=Acer saccharum TaxID=4024 RepID=A0AA39W2F2_ACESA|nr:hypothetical protein LWI29_026189 [Acer saccharum]